MIDCQPIHIESTTGLMNNIFIASTHDYKPKVLYSLKLPEIKVGDIISITSEYEVTSEKKYEVMIASTVSLGSSFDDVRGKWIDEGHGYNITLKMHHGDAFHVRQYKFIEDVPEGAYLNTVVWSASALARGDRNPYIQVEKGYGHLDALIFRANCGVK